MMKKSSGPAFVRRQTPMTECPSCCGAGLIQGVFHQLECIGCHSSGFVHAETLEPLLMQDLVIQLGLLARQARPQLAGNNPARCIIDEYQTPNRRGPGGSSYKGD